MSDTPQKPIHTLRIGALSVAIWQHATQAKTVKGQNFEGKTFYSCKATRAYCDTAGNWQYTDSFGRDELLTVAKLLDLAHTWIWREESKAKKP